MSPQHWLFRSVTIISHPVFLLIWISLILFLIPFYYNELLPFSSKVLLLIPVFVLVLLTIVLSLLAVQLKWIEDFFQPKARQFLLTVYLLLLFVISLNYHQASLPSYYKDFIKLALLYTVGCWFMLFKWNCSFHVYGWSSAFFIFLFYQLIYGVNLIYALMATSVLTGMVASLRLWQEEHVPIEIVRSLVLSVFLFFVTLFLKLMNWWV